jgi:hypothetical protein
MLPLFSDRTPFLPGKSQLFNLGELSVTYVTYRYAISLIFVTFYGCSNPYEVNGVTRFLFAAFYSLLTLLLGWWGLLWGPIRTVQALFVNLTGGREVRR